MLVAHLSIHGQSLVYDAFLRGQQVGEMRLQKEVSDNKTSITSTTHIEAHLLFTLTVDIEIESIYQHGILVESNAVSKQNGNIHSEVSIYRNEDAYTLMIDGEKSALNHAALLGADIFYFEEPKQMKHAIALASGEYLTIEKDADHRYFFVHDGKKERHLYETDTLQRVEIEHSLYTITLKRRK